MLKLLLSNMLVFCLLTLTSAGMAGDKPTSQTSQAKDKPVNGFVLIDMSGGAGDNRPEPSLPGNAEPGTGYDPSGASGGSGDGSGSTQYPSPMTTDTESCSVYNPNTNEWVNGEKIICVSSAGGCAVQSPCLTPQPRP